MLLTGAIVWCLSSVPVALVLGLVLRAGDTELAMRPSRGGTQVPAAHTHLALVRKAG